MLQAVNNQPIEPKAPARAQGSKAEKSKVNDLESKLEGDDFANELEASMGTEASEKEAKAVETEAKAVDVNPELLLDSPSKLIQQPAVQLDGQLDTPNPKVFDANLIQDVDQIIQPKTTNVPVELTNEQVMELAEGQSLNPEMDSEMAQALLKTPQLQLGRSPAIDLAKAEIDPQLMNMDDFVAQKNATGKKSLNNSSAYGMPIKSQVNKVGIEHGLKSTQTVNEIGLSDSSTGRSSMNSQQFILNSQIDSGSNAKINEAQAPVKTFNMSNIKSEDANQVMSQITDYVMQAKASKEPTVNLRVNHEELGVIDITVNKLGTNQDAIAINIGTHSVDGKNFFQANSKDLFTHLTNSGLNVSDLKVETPSQTARNDFDFGSQSGRGGFNQEKQFGSEQNQRRHDSDRRQELWNLLRDKDAA